MDDLKNFPPRALPKTATYKGRYVHLERFDTARHASEIFDYFTTLDPSGEIWTYLPYGPFETLEAYQAFCEDTYRGSDPLFFAIRPTSDEKAAGVMSLMRIDRTHGVIETGHLCFSPRLQRSRAATEALYLLGCHIFDDLGYRRFEWKCNNLNEASKSAAVRFGFTFEGVFRQMMVIKGQNRDTAWFSILDHEWPSLKQKYQAWLAPENFDESGQQIKRLSDF